MNRKYFLSAALMIMLTVAGCGGGNSDKKDESPNIYNPSGTISDLSQLTLQPYEYQAAKIAQGTSFLLSWPSAAAVPQSTSVDIFHFLEGRGGENRTEFRESTELSQRSDASWALRKKGDLAAGGVFYVDVRTALDRRRYAFVVEGGRATALPTGSASTRAEDISTPGTGSLDNMTVLWAGKSSGSVGISTGTDFFLQFPSEAAAPSRFTVRLRRYKERRGSDGFSEDEQPISVSHTAGQNTWSVVRRDNFRLESGATYILEISSDGDPQPRKYVFITEG